MRRFGILLFLLFTMTANLIGQKENKYIRQGNRSYDGGDFQEAEVDYLKSLQTKKSSHRGLFNLGNALYKQDNYFDASSVYDSVRKMNINKETISHAHYNLGNSLINLSRDSAEVSSQALMESIEAYKNSLRINPEDMDAKYNLAYAQRLLKEQQQNQQNQQNQQKQQNQENQQDEQKQEQDQDQQNQQQQDQQNREQQEQQQQKREQPQPQQISKEDAERMLQALKNEEKKTLEDLQKRKVQMAKRVKSEKDW